MKYKVRVNSKNESIEAQDLGKILGYSRPDYEVKDKAIPEGYVCLGFENHDKSVDKLILLVNGFNSVDEDSIRDYVELSLAELRSMVKPKEYLFKGIDETYKVVDHDCQGRAIEIPEGADMYLTGLNGPDWFARNEDNIIYSYGVSGWHKETIPSLPNQNYSLLWQRHTQPEELPFVDDGDDDKCDSKRGNFVVDDTLNQRQSQYGDFSKVAEATQGLMFVANSYSYQNMSDSQKEAIHMIFSKISRLLNGDPNHVDSWHDIAGYATLVVNDLS